MAILSAWSGYWCSSGWARYAAIETGMMPANADGRPTQLERWAARTSLAATLRREAPTSPNPVPLDDANLIAGIKLYAQNCAVCHGAANTAPSNIAKACIRGRRS